MFVLLTTNWEVSSKLLIVCHYSSNVVMVNMSAEKGNSDMKEIGTPLEFVMFTVSASAH